jgi:hypothetical protein
MDDLELLKLKISTARFVSDIIRRESNNEDCGLLRLRLRYVRVILNTIIRVYADTPGDSMRLNSLRSYLVYLVGTYNIKFDFGGEPVIVIPGSIFTYQFTSQFS